MNTETTIAQFCFCSSDVKDPSPSLLNFLLSDLPPLLKDLQFGKKEGSYILRTGVLPGAKSRLDKMLLPMSSLIIIDADKTENEPNSNGAPCPYKVHANLTANGINHLIVRSHSHMLPGYGNRYRIFIPTALPYNKYQLPELNEKALKLCGEPIENVPENSTWSQPWYLPRRPV